MLRRATKIILVSSNMATALLLIVGCFGGILNPQTFWITGVITLGSFYILLLLLFFIFFWLFVKPFLALISVITIAICWVPLSHIVAIRLSPNFVIKKHPANLRVMSWNVEHFDILEHKTHPEQKVKMIAMINELKPDIACFQEMVASDQYPEAINYLPYFTNRLSMRDYHYSYNSKLNFDDKHHFGIITFSKYPIINKQTIAYAPRDYNSIFQYIDILKDKDTFRVFNIHLQSLKFTDDNRRYIETIKDDNQLQQSKSVLSKLKTGFLHRQLQADRIKELMNKSPYPVIVAGDFNDVPNSYAYRTIGDGLINGFEEKGTGIGRTFYSVSPTLRIDHIFADKSFNVEQYLRVKKKLSDHFPIVTDLFYKNSNNTFSNATE